VTAGRLGGWLERVGSRESLAGSYPVRARIPFVTDPVKLPERNPNPKPQSKQSTAA